MRLLLTLVALAVLSGAQTTSSSSGTMSSHNGFSFADTMQTATDVVVADIVSGTGVDNGSEVTVRATLRVARVLSGGLAPGAEVPVTWIYKPLLVESPAATTKVALERGLWFLRKGADGKLTPLQAAVMTSRGYYLPAGAAPRYYAGNATLAQKVAGEIAPMIEEIATQHAADLTPRPYSLAAPMTMPPWAQTIGRFQSLLMALENLDPKAKLEVYADFSARPDPYLRAAGIAGRLGAGDASALIDLEASLGVVAPIFESGSMPLGGVAIDLRNNLPAARALARIAIGPTAVPSIEGNAAFQLASTRSLEFVPYLIVMLGSPAPWTRDSVLMQFCPLLSGSPLWKPEMAGHCPDRSPLNDAAREQAEIGYWISWWEANREQIAKTTPLPTVSAPARYSMQQNPGIRTVEIPIEIRFLSLVNRARPLSGAPPGPHDPVIGQLSEPDRDSYHEVTTAVNAKLDANDKRSEQMMNAARIAGKLPELAQMKALDDDRTAILKTGLDDLRNRLSPAGWQAIEKFFGQMGGGAMIMTSPRPPQ